MKDLEEYKKYWKAAKVNPDALEADNRAMARRLATGKAMSAKQSLARHYLFSFIVSLFLPLLAPVLNAIGFPAWIAIVYGAFGIIMAALSGWFYLELRHTDYYSMPTVAAMKNVLKLSRHSTILGVISFTMASTICALMLWASLDDNENDIFYGLIIGLAIGIVIGIFRIRSKRKHLKTLRDELSSISGE